MALSKPSRGRGTGLASTVFETRAGWVGVAGTSLGLVSVTFPRASEEEAWRDLGLPARHETSLPAFESISRRLTAYYSGQKVDFPDELDLTEATEFEREVWSAAREIPYGETRSYGWLARQIGRPQAARAVGQALGRNPFPIIVPCHRVLGGDGRLCGFGGGLDVKERLLSMEGCLPPGSGPLPGR